MPSDVNFRPKLTICAIGIALICIPGCASLSETMTGFSSSSAAAFAVVDGRVLQGEARLTAERGGSVHLQNAENPPLSCFGPLSYTSTLQGVISLSCSDGRTVAVSFQAFSPLSGAGRGAMEKGDFNLTYGLKPDRAAPYLAVPLARLVPPMADTSGMAPALTPAGP